MTTHDVMLTRCCPIDAHLAGRPTRPAAPRSPRAVVTRARLWASNGGGIRAFDRWRRRADQAWLSQVPERPRVGASVPARGAWPMAAFHLLAPWGGSAMTTTSVSSQSPISVSSSIG